METGRADFSYAVTLSVREGFPIWFRSKSLENEGGAISIVENITYHSNVLGIPSSRRSSLEMSTTSTHFKLNSDLFLLRVKYPLTTFDCICN